MSLDKRLNAYRPDLADIRLKGQVDARDFVEGQPRQVVVPLVPIHRGPQGDAMQLSQGLLGETLRVFEERDGWAFAQFDRDGYVGYVRRSALSETITPPTHRVAVRSTFLYPAASIKTQPAMAVSLNAAVTVTGHDGKFAALADGRFVIAAHLAAVDQWAEDYVAVAQQFHHVPYYWGGKTAEGLDCSGLVQVALEAAGKPALRDSDMQEKSLGQKLMVNGFDGLKRGDLVFWEGHVGIMTDAETLLHANGHHMMVVEEPLRDAVDRIAATGSPVTSIRRL
ncbi:C40 family peptidase [Aestuariivirga sp.]|uniref:C40 family peptidase n=1 Tax=Aestuariivirga sp. TaxID=2650926 RepID=UPI0039E37D26